MTETLRSLAVVVEVNMFASLFSFSWENSTILITIVCALLAYLLVVAKKKQSYWKEKGIKYAEPIFLIGDIPVCRSKSEADRLLETYNSYPNDRYYGYYQLLQPVLVIKDLNLIKLITVKEFDHFVNHKQMVDVHTDPLWSGNLFVSRDEKWRDLRSTLSPSFTSSKMKVMFSLMEECAQQFIEYFKEEKSEVVELEMKDTFSRYTNDVIATTAFGLKCDSLKNKTNDFYLMGKEITNVTAIRILSFFLYASFPAFARLAKLRFIPVNIANFFSRIIIDTIKTRTEKQIVRPDMIHLLLEAQKGRQHEEENLQLNEEFSSVSESEVVTNRRHKMEITLEDIISQAFIFFLAGFETASTLLSFLFYEIGINPEIQQRLREEIETVSEKVTYETLLGLNYLDMVVSETLRKWPPAIYTDREVTKSFTISPEKPGEKALHLEKGTVCQLPVFALHHDSNLYPDPEKFDPERFNDQNKHNIHPFGYLPFGAGPRSCIGSRFALLESKLIVFHVLKNFEVLPVSRTQIPMILDNRNINLAPKGGMWLGLKKLN